MSKRLTPKEVALFAEKMICQGTNRSRDLKDIEARVIEYGKECYVAGSNACHQAHLDMRDLRQTKTMP